MSPRPSIVTCETLLAQISAYLDGDLGAATCQAIERHASGCAVCDKVIRDFRAATGLCRSAADAPLPKHVRDLARRRIRALLRRS